MSVGRILDALVFMIYPHDEFLHLYSSSTIAPSTVEALTLSGVVWPSNYGVLGAIVPWYGVFLNNTQVTMTYLRLV